MDEMYVVIEGTVEDGLTDVSGPFKTEEAAQDYIDDNDIDAAFVREVSIVESEDDEDEDDDDEDEDWDDDDNDD